MKSARLAAIKQAAREGRVADALREADALCDAAPHDLDAARLRAMLLTHIGNPQATAAWQRVAALAPRDPEAHFQLGNAAGDAGDFVGAVEHLEIARVTLPGHPVLLNNLALALEAVGRVDEAAAHWRQALAAAPHAASGVRQGLARVLSRAGRHADALQQLDALIAQDNTQAPWLAARAACLAALGRDADVPSAYEAALARDPRAAAVWHDFARWLLAHGRFDDAEAFLARAHAALPSDALVTSLFIVARQRSARWEGVARLREELIAAVADPHWSGSASGYDFVTVCDDPRLQRRVAERYAAPEVAAVTPLPAVALPADRSARLRLGFVSSDYRDHPVGRLIVGLLERLDRARFDVLAYTTGCTDDVMGGRIAAASTGGLHALPRREPHAAAQKVRADGVDVLFDLNGFSGGEALRLFAARAAPLQVNFLGYTGTLGTGVHDLIVADRCSIPLPLRGHYAEQVMDVEPCYLPSDPARTVDGAPSRAAYGLPADGVVFYAGSALYKVSPELFAAWLELLRAQPRAVLWLRDAPAGAIGRVHAAAQSIGLDPARIVFAPPENVPRYLARLRLADVFLDTFPFGSHTSVNDALFMGVPVVTIAGQSFAGRASASQVHAAGIGDLVAHDVPAYVGIAGELARNPAQLRDAKARLRDVRQGRLFDADRYAAAFGEAIVAAWNHRRA